jgi:hypothetical protein
LSHVGAHHVGRLRAASARDGGPSSTAENLVHLLYPEKDIGATDMNAKHGAAGSGATVDGVLGGYVDTI